MKHIKHIKHIKIIILLITSTLIYSSCNNNNANYFNDFDNTKNYNAIGFAISNFLVFYDYENDATFYIGDTDNYIYRKKDNINELIFERKVSNLQFHDNTLYFTMLNNGNDNKGLHYANERGYIYSYDYKNDILKCLVEENVLWFKYDKQGLLYIIDEVNYINGNKNSDYKYYIKDKNGYVKEIEWHDIITYHGDNIISKENDKQLYNIFLKNTKTKEEEILIENIDVFGIIGSVFDNKYIYYGANGIIYNIDIPNHSYITYDLYTFNCIPKERFTEISFGIINSLTMINDEIYFSFQYQNEIYKINKNGECELFLELLNNSLDLNDNELFYENGHYKQNGKYGNIAFLNRDNKNLYIYTHSGTSNSALRLITIPVIEE